MTGSGKTYALKQLEILGQQTIDLEELAQHQGSSFGTLGHLIQPSQEQFENDLALQLYKQDLTHPIWVEDESLTIGKRFIPKNIFYQIRSGQVYKLVIPQSIRIAFLAKEYGTLDPDFLV